MWNPLISHSLHSAWTWLNTEFSIFNVYFQSNNFKSGNSRMACSIKYTLYWKWWQCILQMKENKCVWWEWGIFDLITWKIRNTRNVCDFSGNNLYCQFTVISHSIYYTKLSHKFTFWPVHPLHLILIYKLQMLFKNDPPTPFSIQWIMSAPLLNINLLDNPHLWLLADTECYFKLGKVNLGRNCPS